MRHIVNAYCMIYAICYLLGRWILRQLDSFGAYMAWLCDHSDFFAGAIWTFVIMSAWQMLTK